jgi:glycosyltransferase involved in cell wall biosynthesis
MQTYVANEEHIKSLLIALFATLKIRITPFSLLKEITKHWDKSNLLNGIWRLLNAWGIDARLTPLDIKLLNNIPTPSLVLLLDSRFERRARIVILLKGGDDVATFLDPELGIFVLTHCEIKSRWSNLVIALDADLASDEYEYERKYEAQQRAINQCSGVSVIMPVYNQETFIARALVSLQLQTYKKWELIVIDDNSEDGLYDTLLPFLKDERIRYFKNESNKGLGYSLNKGLDKASHNLIAYLPSDDIYFKHHLQTLIETLLATNSTLAFSGVLHHSNEQFNGVYGLKACGQIDGYPLQLVQVLHVQTKERWLERDELVTDDLNRMFWHKFTTQKNKIIGTREITCEWVDHPLQRHKIINDRKGGGIFYYKQYYKVKERIKFQSCVGNYIDEVDYFKPYNKSYSTRDGALKILLVGELAYNPERMIALEERGHKLYGIWIDRPANYNAVGKLPFGNIEDISQRDCNARIREIKPDIIYGLLNYQAVSLAYKILMENPGIPFVWHFKEGPSYCLQNGTWQQLLALYRNCDGRMYTNVTLQTWFEHFLPVTDRPSFVMDGELPKKEWFLNERSTLLSNVDNEIHTVFVGRPIGISPDDVLTLAEQRIHLHFYGDIFHVAYNDFLKHAVSLAPKFIHTHPNCAQDKWVTEFSQYDAGWLHLFKSHNYGELLRADWFDLNNPARISTYAMAGLPMLQRDNSDHIVAAQSITDQLDIGVTFKTFSELKVVMGNNARMDELRRNVWANRFHFCFDAHADELILFFRKVIQHKLDRTKGI